MPSTTFHIPDDFLQEIDRAARTLHMSRNRFVLQACGEALARQAEDEPRRGGPLIAVLDTTAFSAAMRHDAGLAQFLKSRAPGDVATVPPVVAEIEYGIQRIDPSSRKRALLELEKDRILGIVKVFSWTPEASSLFGSIKARLEQDGELVDDFDIAIAAIAMSHKASVLTANLAHFSRVSGLSCSHWE
jgi:tRNA(fMet)-specific endonuclease VapC